MIILRSNLVLAVCVLWGSIATPAQVPTQVEAEWGIRPSATLEAISQNGYLKASNTGAGDRYGSSVAASGDTFVIGSPREDSTGVGVDGDQGDGADSSGAAYVFVRGPTGWSQQAYLKASNTGVIDKFGTSVAISGDTLVVGAVSEGSDATGVDGDQANDNSLGAGAVYVFVRTGSTWSQQAYLKAFGSDLGRAFGSSVAISGDTIVVGAPAQAPAAPTPGGAAYVFVRSGTTWSTQQALKGSNTELNDEFGFSVAIDGDTILVGAPEESSVATGVDGDELDNSFPRAGAAYVFQRSGTSWTQQAYLKASATNFFDLFGWAVGLSGDTAVVGAPNEASGAVGIDGDDTDNTASDAGAVYAFVRNGTSWSQQAYIKASNTASRDGFGTSLGMSGERLVVGSPGEGGWTAGVNGNQNTFEGFDSGALYAFARCGSSWTQQAHIRPHNVGTADEFATAVAISGDRAVAGAPFEASQATGVNGDGSDNSATSAGASYAFELSLWTDLGGGTVGIAGQPTLTATSELHIGCDLAVDLAQAPPAGLTLLWAAFSSTPFSALGGTVHTFPYDVQQLLVTDAAGAIHLEVPVPASTPPGLELYFQFVVQDVSTLHGLTLSNAVTATVP